MDIYGGMRVIHEESLREDTMLVFAPPPIRDDFTHVEDYDEAYAHWMDKGVAMITNVDQTR